ncbi:MAG: hypothetical protein MHM6MM_000150 [Cercozoa sp. M6MM]
MDFSSLEAATEALEKSITALESDVEWHALMKSGEPLEQARAYATAAYSLNAMFYSWTRLQGISEHEVQDELRRVQQYVGRIKEASKQGARPAVDEQKARRFIAAGVDSETRQELRKSGSGSNQSKK